MADKIVQWSVFVLALLSIVTFIILRSTGVIDWSWGWISVPILLLIGDFIYWLFYGIGEMIVDGILLLVCYIYMESVPEEKKSQSEKLRNAIDSCKKEIFHFNHEDIAEDYISPTIFYLYSL